MIDTAMSYNIRLKCLELAVKGISITSPNEAADDVIKLADKYFNFIYQGEYPLCPAIHGARISLEGLSSSISRIDRGDKK